MTAGLASWVMFSVFHSVFGDLPDVVSVVGQRRHLALNGADGDDPDDAQEVEMDELETNSSDGTS